jgi:hypothetical protein
MELFMFDRNAHGGDWVPTLLSLEPDLAPALARVGIRDEHSYLDREGAMPRRIRNEVALARRDLLLLDGIPLRDLVRVSPPWLRALTLLDIGTPQPVAEHLSRSGVTRVEDMITMAEVPGGEAAARVLRLALYRAGRSGAPKPQQTPAPAPDRVIGLVSTAPEEVRSMAFTDLPGLPSRAVNAARSAGIRNVGDLAHWSDKDLKMLPCFGEGTLQGVLCSLECAIEGAVVSVEEEPEPCP